MYASRFSISLIVLIFISISAFSQTDSLDNYINKLKLSRANGGSETAFLSIGSDFMYGQEYFEAGNFSSAAWYFNSIVRNHKDHAYANYQLAICLLKQNDLYKAESAKQYLEASFNAQPSLRERFKREMSAGTENTQTQDAGKPVKDENTKAGLQSGLDAYIERLKYSYANSGKETAMLTAGQEAIAGIEYYEKGEFGLSDSRFSLSLAIDPANPYVNYMKAVSLAAQGNVKSANNFYAKAIAGDETLKQRYVNDVSKAKISWDKLQSSKTIKTTPTAKITYGGPLVYGNYTCHQSIWNGPHVSPAYRNQYHGYFQLRKDGTYRWLDNGGTGKFKYDSKTGLVTWLSGPMKGQDPRSSKFQPGTKTAQITVEFSDNYRWNCGCNK